MRDYIVKSESKCAINPRRCWMNIGVDKLERAAREKQKYYFLFIIDGEEILYSCPSEELLTAFENKPVRIMENYPRYSFYADYDSGLIFGEASVNDVTPVMRLTQESRKRL